VDPVRAPVLSSASSSSQLQWWLAAGVAALLISASGFVFGRRHSASRITVMTAAPKQSGKTSLLIEALNEEQSQLELERLQGTISSEGYVSARRALEETAQRALARAGTGCATRT
jgi:hypothetical protein